MFPADGERVYRVQVQPTVPVDARVELFERLRDWCARECGDVVTVDPSAYALFVRLPNVHFQPRRLVVGAEYFESEVINPMGLKLK